MLLKQKIKNISQNKIKEENSCFVICINSIKIEFVSAGEKWQSTEIEFEVGTLTRQKMERSDEVHDYDRR